MSDNNKSQDIFLESEALEVAALKEKLEQTYEQRIESHENARKLMEDLMKIGEGLRAKSQRTA